MKKYFLGLYGFHQTMLNIVFKAVEAYQVLSINNCFYLGNK
jgi:hypothetical protein